MKCKTLLLLFILTAVLFGCSSYGKASNPLDGGEMMFWKVSDEDSCVYLLGSMHFGKAEFYPMPTVIESAYQNSDLLGVEIDMLSIDTNAMQMSLIQNMSYTDGTKLIDHISPQTIELLSSYLQEKGLSIDSFGNMKPGMITMSISAMEAQLAGLNAEYGIDMHYLKKAKEDDKTIVEFESIDSQLNMLFADEEVAEGMLYSTLKESKDFKLMLDSLATIWQTGDARAMNELLTQAETQEEGKYLETLFGDRDVKMTNKIEEILAEDKSGFIILGAGHFVNDTGIINRLATSKKYKVVKY